MFRSRREVVTVDAIVRDKSGAIVRGLTAEDFEVREDGRPQEVLNFSFEEIKDKAPAPIETADLLAGVEARLQEQTQSPAAPAAAAAAAPAAAPTVGVDGRAAADHAAVRRQLDAAGGRAARGRFGAEVRQREDERRRHGRRS